MNKQNLWQKISTVLTLTSFSFLHILLPANAQVNNYFENQGNSVSLYVPPPERQGQGICANFLQPTINSIVQQSRFRSGKWAILVRALRTGQTLYALNPNSYMIPASNMKILTTTAALQKLDPNISKIRSKSLREWINVTNLRSNNYYADTLLRYIGGAGSAKQALTQLGVHSNGYRIADGSGLSRRNKVTPTAIVEALTAITQTSNSDLFYGSLPVAGVSGTLARRMKWTPAQGNVRGKTGTLRGVRALSGYVKNNDFGTLVYSIIVNQPNQSGRVLNKGIDDIAVTLSLLKACD
ncbi:MAG: D-alanyl-D-alanine carboxypeptidase/D-alanyl-D-alanine-endopeptidase [Cyanobacteria bacterium J083]|nr:MAG: D-alanyl-D-alanine carboxypeptidase/D-alanyl-D-alanine-endopeptidase [Cyanobacteria bacterium J083]